MNFSYKRNWKEAIGFYIAYFVIGLILLAISGSLAGTQNNVTTFDEGFEMGAKIGAMMAIIYSLVLSLIVLIQGKLHKNYGYLILALLSPILAVFGALLAGMIIPAFLTTRIATVTEKTAL